MAQHLIYHWKHGWIPLTHAAALSKAHGNAKLADKYVPGASAHHASRPTAGKSAREIHGGLEAHNAGVVARNADEASKLTHGTHATVHGMDEYGAPMKFTGRVQGSPTNVKIKEGHGGKVQPHVAVSMHNGSDNSGMDATARTTVYVPHASLQAQAEEQRRLEAERKKVKAQLAGKRAPAGAAAPAASREHFRMTGKELQEKAAGGDAGARAELDRRAARKAAGGKPAPKASPAAPPKKAAPAKTETQLNAEAHPLGSRVRAEGNLLGTVTGHSDYGVKVKLDVGRSAYLSRHKLTQAGNAPHTTVPPVDGPRNPHEARDRAAVLRAEQENARILSTGHLAGHTISSRVFTHRMDLTPALIHTHRNDKGERIGSVIDSRDGLWRANLDAGRHSEDLGSFTDRGTAHLALAERHRAAAEAAQKKAAAAAATRERRAAAAAKQGPVGGWQPHTLESDGTRAGAAAAAKVKQAFKMGGHHVLIETAMTKDQTRVFLGNVHSVLLKTGMLDDSNGVTFHVPSGDSKFRQSRRGLAGAYVRSGQRTVFVNPKIANGAMSDHFGGTGAGDSFMPAAKGVNGQQYVLSHELGHVIDNDHGHTHEDLKVGVSGRTIIPVPRDAAAALAREHKSGLSKYGKSNLQESYAEAYAQWVHGGPGSNPVSDAYAAQYGWKTPKWYREGRTQ